MIMYFLLLLTHWYIKSISFSIDRFCYWFFFATGTVPFFSLYLLCFFFHSLCVYEAKPLKLLQHIRFHVYKQKVKKKKVWEYVVNVLRWQFMWRREEKYRNVANIKNWHKHSATLENVPEFRKNKFNFSSCLFTPIPLLCLSFSLLESPFQTTFNTLYILSVLVHMDFEKWFLLWSTFLSYQRNCIGNGF